MHRKEGGIYKLGKESRYFKEISQLIHFTDEEAHIVNQLIEGAKKEGDPKALLCRQPSFIARYLLSSLYDIYPQKATKKFVFFPALSVFSTASTVDLQAILW